MSDGIKVSCALVFAQEHNAETVLNAISIARPRMGDNASLWLWAKGTYRDGSVSFSTYEIAKELKKLGWAVRNEIVWRCKAGDPAPDNRLKRAHETVFHLTIGRNYYYDRTIDGTVISEQEARKLGSSYAKKISESTTLTEEEKVAALAALAEVSSKMESGDVADFRMALRGIHKVDKWMASKLDKFGFHVRASKCHAPMVGDVWDDWSNETNACVPLGMAARMVRLTCPRGGHVLDLFPEVVTAKAVMACGCNYESVFRKVELVEPVSQPEAVETNSQPTVSAEADGLQH